MLWEQFIWQDAPVVRKDHLSFHIRAMYLRDELMAASTRREPYSAPDSSFPTATICAVRCTPAVAIENSAAHSDLPSHPSLCRFPLPADVVYPIEQ
jgi:hypothetical protein